LKHAHDIWNSNIFLVVVESDACKARELLTGTFHEIRDKIKLIEVEKIDELFRRKKAYRAFEAELGISQVPSKSFFTHDFISIKK